MAQSTPEFICDYCGRSYTKRHNIVSHINKRHDTPSCACDICEKKFESRACLKMHLIRGHNRFNQGDPECDLCGKIFARKHNVVSHLQTRHLIGGKMFEKSCEVCNKKFSNFRNLKRHISILHNSYFEHPSCDECNKVFKKKEALDAHIQAVHKVSAKDMHRCHLCERVFPCQKNLKRHEVNYHGVNKEYKCSNCTEAFATNNCLRRHVKSVHNIDLPNESYTCDRCSRVFSEQALLDAHISLHHKRDSISSQKFSCKCGKSFDSERTLKKHKADHEFDDLYSCSNNSVVRTRRTGSDKAKKPSSGYDCETCQEHFGLLNDLRNHMKLNHEIQLSLETCNVCFTKLYSKEAMSQHQKVCVPPNNAIQCSECEKLFTAKSSLSLHMKVFHKKISNKNSRDKPNKLKCEYCEKKFKVKWNVQKHIEYVHLGMKRYRCLECESHFKEKRNLRKHIRLKHPDSATFPQCHFCRKRFESAKSCKIHLMQDHSFDTKTFPCEICSATYSTNDSLVLHMRTKHTEEEELFKCEACSILFKGYETYEKHSKKCQKNASKSKTQERYPRCVICIKDFCADKSLKRHIKKFHEGFNPTELTELGYSKKTFVIDCEDCLKRFTDKSLYEIYLKNRHNSETIVFECSTCAEKYNIIEFAVQRYKKTMRNRKRKRPYDSEEEDSDRQVRVKEPGGSKYDVNVSCEIKPEILSDTDVSD